MLLYFMHIRRDGMTARNANTALLAHQNHLLNMLRRFEICLSDQMQHYDMLMAQLAEQQHKTLLIKKLQLHN